MDRGIAGLLKEKAFEIGVSLGEEEISKFLLYKDLLVSHNKNVNLTAITDEKEIIIKHFIDSLTVNEFIKNGANIIDVGTGAGFPGVPLKITRKDILLTLLDSLNKRIIFLDNAVKKLKLDGVICVGQRAEDAGVSPEHRERYDVSVSRAVAPLGVLSEYCLPFVKVGGLFAALKGGNIQGEIESAKTAIEKLGGTLLKAKSFSLEDNLHFRTIVLIEKTKPTPEGFPRRAGKPSRSPL